MSLITFSHAIEPRLIHMEYMFCMAELYSHTQNLESAWARRGIFSKFECIPKSFIIFLKDKLQILGRGIRFLILEDEIRWS